MTWKRLAVAVVVVGAATWACLYVLLGVVEGLAWLDLILTISEIGASP